MKDLYLILYNSACCLGWAAVWVFGVQHMLTSETSLAESSASMYAQESVAKPLSLVQMAALMEILHALVKLVRSPVMVTTMQVMSRIVALAAIECSVDAQSKW